jgi:hypothetical protein
VKSDKILERSVDSLQRLYAAVIALSIGQAANVVFIDQATKTFDPRGISSDVALTFIAFMVTVVPFFHGMNRHLDQSYLINKGDRVSASLLFDFIVFFLESTLLFVLSASIRSGMSAFLIIGLILAIDTIWSLISQWMHYKKIGAGTGRWSAINFTAIVIGIFVYSTAVFQEALRVALLTLVCIVRSVADYYFSWRLYFPESIETTEESAQPIASSDSVR